jgi:hypothetical protein
MCGVQKKGCCPIINVIQLSYFIYLTIVTVTRIVISISDIIDDAHHDAALPQCQCAAHGRRRKRLSQASR